LEVRSIYYEFSKEKPISEINKELLEKENQVTGTRGSIRGRATWHADVSMTSAGGSGSANVSSGPY
jgi:hypothetical protein